MASLQSTRTSASAGGLASQLKPPRQVEAARRAIIQSPSHHPLGPDSPYRIAKELPDELELTSRNAGEKHKAILHHRNELRHLREVHGNHLLLGMGSTQPVRMVLVVTQNLPGSGYPGSNVNTTATKLPVYPGLSRFIKTVGRYHFNTHHLLEGTPYENQGSPGWFQVGDYHPKLFQSHWVKILAGIPPWVATPRMRK